MTKFLVTIEFNNGDKVTIERTINTRNREYAWQAVVKFRDQFWDMKLTKGAETFGVKGAEAELIEPHPGA
jgi:hypothetical protein